MRCLELGDRGWGILAWTYAAVDLLHDPWTTVIVKSSLLPSPAQLACRVCCLGPRLAEDIYQPMTNDLARLSDCQTAINSLLKTTCTPHWY